MNEFQIPIERNLLDNVEIRPRRRKRIFHKTNPLVRVRQFPTFGDIRKSVEPQGITGFQK